MDCSKTGLEDRLASSDFENGEMFDLEEEVVSAGKRDHGVSATSTSIHLTASAVLYEEGVSRVSLKSVQSNFDEYREVLSDPNEASRGAVPMMFV